METLIIERLNGVRQDINEIRGARLLEVIDNGPQPETQYEQMEGLDGSIENGTTFRPRTITVRFWFKGIDILDYTLAQREIWKFLFLMNHIILLGLDCQDFVIWFNVPLLQIRG
ncbi:phage tail domain-containing protein [Niallia circulans]